MPHSDAIPAPQSFNDQHIHIRAAFVARLKSGAHLLNGQCGTGEDLCWLRAEGYVVTACEAVLAAAKVASQQSGQAVRVCPLAQMHSVLPYDGIWLSRPLDSDAATLAPLLQQLATLLKAGAPICFPLQPSGKISHDQLTLHLQQLVTTAGIALQLAPMPADSANMPPYANQSANQYVMLLRGVHQAS
ncbi:class I SAM-dependent methyltransferase [Aeromonas fluvialis]|uniref:class I SAM-dependent methyltransferase n=1 Tax=Aeromonas fluvialis TaxID=591962 RepID=UPI0005AB39FF|nr:class I SAM-dependent methyltransferase [Aeromonas fluvialis]